MVLSIDTVEEVHMSYRRTLRRAVIPALAFVVVLAAPAHADLISDWNNKAEAIAIEKRTISQVDGRRFAILHVAMFEAVNAVERRYTPYRLKLAADRSVSKEAAAAAAAHAVLTSFHPDQQASLDAALESSLAAVADGESKALGVALGRTAAAQLLALRVDDGFDAPESYRPSTTPGLYVPTTIPVSSNVAAVTPWVMEKGSQFRPAPPPALDSETWTTDVNEIRELGGRDSTKRTARQTEIGRFWFVTGPQTWNPIVRQLAAAKQLDLLDSARLFALVALATADTHIAVFDAKFHYNLWRPITAIRNGDQTGNPNTPRDPSWQPLGATPMHPEYPCAHCITSAAVGAVLTSTFGNDIPEVTLTSSTAPGVTHKWTRVQDYVEEVSSARIYAGFHYRFSTKVGQEMGRKIGELTVATQLRGAEAAASPSR
jgi:hypothetical protein